jgi:hypothetical protein
MRVKTLLRTGYCTVVYKRENVTETTYTNLRQTLASVLDRVANDHEVVIVSRRATRGPRWFRQTSWPG